jgi:hypothetical protein
MISPQYGYNHFASVRPYWQVAILDAPSDLLRSLSSYPKKIKK